MLNKGLHKKFGGPPVVQNLTADEHTQVQAGPEKPVDISPFPMDKKVGQKASQETAAGALVTCHDHCQLKKALSGASQPRALLQHSAPVVSRRSLKPTGVFRLRREPQYENNSMSAIGKRKEILKSLCRVVTNDPPAYYWSHPTRFVTVAIESR